MSYHAACFMANSLYSFMIDNGIELKKKQVEIILEYLICIVEIETQQMELVNEVLLKGHFSMEWVQESVEFDVDIPQNINRKRSVIICIRKINKNQCETF